MKQALSDIPQNREELRRRKGPAPAIAYVIAIGLFLALAGFYFPAWLGSLKELFN